MCVYMEKIVKQFLRWIGFKEKLHNQRHEPPLFKEGEIWWCYVGENIGVEVNGKGEQFTRPIFIFRKYDRYSFLGLPLTTKQKKGSWYVGIHFKEVSQNIVLVQGRVFDYRRLKEKLGELSNTEVEAIHDAYFFLHNRLPIKK